MAAEDVGAVASGEVEIDGAYFGGYVKPANWTCPGRMEGMHVNFAPKIF